jgi:hypothetical protein
MTTMPGSRACSKSGRSRYPGPLAPIPGEPEHRRGPPAAPGSEGTPCAAWFDDDVGIGRLLVNTVEETLLVDEVVSVGRVGQIGARLRQMQPVGISIEERRIWCGVVWLLGFAERCQADVARNPAW